MRFSRPFPRGGEGGMGSKANKKLRRGTALDSRVMASIHKPPVTHKPQFPVPVWALPAALIAAWLAFGPSLNGPFVFDDFHLPFADPRAAQMPALVWIGGVRPL